MFSADHFVHFVFDLYNETHYTDTLLKLQPEAYVWYELKKQHIDNAIFISGTGKDFRVGSYDSESEAILKPEKKKFFAKAQADTTQRLLRVMHTPQELGADDQSLLGLLLDRQESQKNKRVALVFTWDAFSVLYESAREKDRQRLQRLCNRPAGRNLLLIRVPMIASEMEKAFLNPQSPLHQLCPGVSQAVSGPREALMDALERQLDRQIFHAYRLTQTDALGMLMRKALVKGDWPDNMRDLEDQAACMYGDSLSGSVCIPREKLYNQLQEEGAQEKLRARAAQLRKNHPRLSMMDAALGEAKNLRGPSPLEDNSNLAKNVRTLPLPEEFLREYPLWENEMDQVREAFCTVWNKSRNRAACQWADAFCTEIRSAAKREDWDALSDALTMLRFCGDENCSSADYDEGLNAICEEGKTMINLAYNVFLQKRELEKFDGDKHAGGLMGWKVDQMTQMQHKITVTKYETDLTQLQMMRTTLSGVIADFKKRHVSQDVVEQFYREAKKRLEQQMDGLADVAEPAGNIATPNKKNPDLNADFDIDLDELMLDTRKKGKKPAPVSQSQHQVYTEEKKAADKQAADDLLKRTFL